MGNSAAKRRIKSIIIRTIRLRAARRMINRRLSPDRCRSVDPDWIKFSVLVPVLDDKSPLSAPDSDSSSSASSEEIF